MHNSVEMWKSVGIIMAFGIPCGSIGIVKFMNIYLYISRNNGAYGFLRRRRIMAKIHKKMC